MAAPHLSLGVSAPGVQQVLDMVSAVDALKRNLQELKTVAGGSNLSGLESLSKQMRGMRQDIVEGIAGLRTTMAEGFEKMYASAAQQVKEGGEKVARATKEANTKIKVASESVNFGGGVKVSTSGQGLGAVDGVRETLALIRTNSGALQAQYAKELVTLEKSVEAVMRAATHGPNTMRGSGYIKWWEQVIAEQDKAQATLRASYAKSISDLEKQVAATMRAATKPPNTMRGAGYIKWWEQVVIDMEKGEALIRKKQADIQTLTARGYVGQAMASAGMYSSLGAGSRGELRNVPKDLDEIAKKGPPATAAIRTLSGQMNDAHSAARGLASGFGAMWLTWGNIAPLLAGAAVSHTIAKTLSIGAEVQNSIKFMEILSDGTVASSEVIRTAMREISRESKFALVDLSKTFVELGQAGKTQAESLTMLKPISDLATAGQVDLATATKLVIQVQALYGLSTENTNKLASQLYATTKSGVINVEDLGASFKYASEANTRFGASVEESLVILKALGQAGLKGSPGGTAMINFMRDIYGRSGPAIKALHDLEKATGQTIKIFTDEGGVQRARSFFDIFQDIVKAARQMQLPEADKLLGRLFSDRGGRTYYSLLRDINSGLDEQVQKLKEVDEQMAAIAAKRLLQETIKGNLQLLKAEFSATLDTVSQRFEQGFMQTLQKLSQAASSSEFQKFLSAAIYSVQGLVSALITLWTPLSALATVWLEFKILGVITGLFGTAAAALATLAGGSMAAGAASVGAAKGFAGAGIAAIAMAAETRAAALGMDAVAAASVRSGVAAAAATGPLRALAIAVGFLTNPWVGLATTIALVGAAWWTVSSQAETATENLTRNVVKNGALNLTQWTKEIELLQRRNSLLGVKPDQYASAEETLASLEKERLKTLQQIQEVKDQSQFAMSRVTGKGAVENIAATTQEKVWKLEVRYAQQVLNLTEARKTLDAARTKDAVEALEKQAAEERRLAAQLDRFKQGSAVAPPKEPPKTRGGAGYDNELQTLQANMATRQRVLENAYANERKILDAKHRAELISEGTYQAEVLRLAQAEEGKRRDEIAADTLKYIEAYQARRAELQATTTDAKKLEEALGNLDNNKKKFLEGQRGNLNILGDNIATRRTLAVIGLDRETNKLIETNDDYWAKFEQGIKKEAAGIEAKHALADASEDVRVRAEAEARTLEAGSVAIAKLKDEAEAAQKHLLDFSIAVATMGLPAEDVQPVIDALTLKVVKLREAAETSAAKLKALATMSGDSAVKNLENQTTESLRKSVKAAADAVPRELAKAIMNGGKDGFKGLRDWVKTYFIKEPIRIVLEGFLKPVGTMVGNFAMNAMGIGGSAMGATSGAGGGGSSALGTAGSIAGIAGSVGMFGSGVASGLTAWGAGGSVTGLLGSGSALFAGGIANGLGVIAGALGPIALAIGALLIIAKATKGETRSGGTYNYTPGSGVSLAHGPSGGELASKEVKVLIASTVAGINDTLKNVGSGLTLNSFIAGLESSEKGRGGVMAGGTLSNGLSFGETGAGSNYAGTYYESFSAQTLDGEQAIKNFTTEMLQVTIQALQAASGFGSGGTSQMASTVTSQALRQVVVGYTEAGEVWGEQLVETTETIYTTVAEAAVEQASDMPNVIRDLLRNVNAETLSDEDAKALIDKINAIVTAVVGFRTAIEPLPSQFDNIRNLSFDMTHALIEAAGGMDKLTAGISAYFENFFSETEKREATASNIAKTLTAAGYSVSGGDVLSATRVQFRAIVESMDVTTESGRRVYAALMSVAGAFASLTESAAGTTTDLVSLEEAVADAHQVLVDTLTREISALEEGIAKWKNFGDSLRDLRDDLLFNDALSPLTPQQKYEEAARIFEEIRAKAMAGDETAMGQLPGAAQSFLEASREFNASGGAYLVDFGRVQQVLSLGITKADRQVSLLERQSTLMQKQLDTLLGTQSTTVTIAQAIVNLAAAIAALVAAGGDPAPLTPGTGPTYVSPGGGVIYNQELIHTITGGSLAVEDARAQLNEAISSTDPSRFLNVYNAVKRAGFTLSDLDNLMTWQAGTSANFATSMGWPVFASGAAFSNGIVTKPTAFSMGMMGEADSEAIMPLANIGGYLGVRSTSDDAVVAQMQVLVEEVRELRRNNTQGAKAIIAANYAANEQAADTVVQGNAQAMARIKYHEKVGSEARPK